MHAHAHTHTHAYTGKYVIHTALEWQQQCRESAFIGASVRRIYEKYFRS